MRNDNSLACGKTLSGLRRLTVSIILLLFCASASASGLQPPRGKVILTVSGAIAEGDKDTPVHFDLSGLEALGVEHIETANPWISGTARFSGVPLRVLLNAVGAYGKTIRAKALNDYRADIPLSDLEEYQVMVALRRDGEEMPVRDKGPIWIIYPISGDPTKISMEVRQRMVWQLNALEVLE